MSEDSGRLTGSHPTGQAPAGLVASRIDPERMFEILVDLECALVLTRNHAPEATVGSFVDSSIQFKRLSDFLHSIQHIEEAK